MDPYNGQRGRGFIDVCTELSTELTRQWTSVYETYLSGVEFARFSDESDTLDEQDDSYDDDDSIPDLEFIGEDTVFEAHFEGGYADF
jgi:hypothetical protein